MSNKSAEYWIQRLDLQPHPEGGYFREAFLCQDKMDVEFLNKKGYSGKRRIYTSILYLLKSEQFSHLHRLKSDELWSFFSGSPLAIHHIDEEGNYSEEILGADIDRGCSFMRRVKARNWFGAEVIEEDSYSLVGCFVSPGFDYADFEMANRDELIRKFPQHKGIIRKLTKVSK
ncbi:MAG: cupin domain-containing protein [Bacteroidetes bacterium]|nr:cupin domain-containing protein [Bacteroidota bacterium]